MFDKKVIAKWLHGSLEAITHYLVKYHDKSLCDPFLWNVRLDAIIFKHTTYTIYFLANDQ